ncbi:MAG: hypothetical protein KatS3mg129_0026 [Leptospiraceae bacterium]|nr:MAG: hypothetical protein KatS3mg129_0026 [Leptospiraceae bacterium]
MARKKDKSDVFFQVPKEKIKTSIGDIELPILYYDVNLTLVFYFVKPEKANEVLKNTDLEAIRFYNGKSLIALALFEYKDTTVGIYNEVGLAIGVKEKNKNASSPTLQLLKLLLKTNPENIPIGFYVAHLPVTTKEANVAGREIWGYPKFVTDIPLQFDLENSQLYGSVKDPETKKSIFELQGNLKGFIAIPAFDLITYTYLENKLIRTIINVSGNFRFSFNKSFRLTNIDSEHPMAKTIQILGLENQPSYAVMYSTNWQSRLNKGTVVLESKYFSNPVLSEVKKQKANV